MVYEYSSWLCTAAIYDAMAYMAKKYEPLLWNLRTWHAFYIRAGR
jgi:hypothetical protein